MEYVLILFSFILVLAGIAGSVLPVLPGPPLAWAGVLLMSFTEASSISVQHLIISAVIAGVITALDYIIPVWGTKKFGGTKAGVRGSTIGLIVGLFFSPFGLISIIIMPMLGAFIAEMIQERNSNRAFKSAVGSFVGFLMGSGLKLIYGFYAIYVCISDLWIIGE